MATSTNNSSANTKYRPYFTSPEIDELIFCLKHSSSNVGLIRYLETFRAKISFDSVSKVVATPRPTIADKLGLSDLEPTPAPTNAYAKELFYNLWLQSPERLTIKQLELAHTYRYENDLMTTEEEADFEKQIGI